MALQLNVGVSAPEITRYRRDIIKDIHKNSCKAIIQWRIIQLTHLDFMLVSPDEFCAVCGRQEAPQSSPNGYDEWVSMTNNKFQQY